MNRFNIALKLKGLLSGLLLSLCCVSTALFADDTEIFFGQASDQVDSNPNVLFILDTSGSMNNRDGGTTSRMNRLKEAMYALIDQSSSFNVGLMGFSGHQRGGSVRYPVGYLEGALETNCPDTGCPDELVVARPRKSSDDAIEIISTNEVIVRDDSLLLGEFEDSSVATPPPTQDLLTGVAQIESSAEEYFSNTTSLTISEGEDISNMLSWSGAFPVEDNSPTTLAYRFTDIALPANAILTDAYIEFTNHDTNAAIGDLSVNITAEATATPEFYIKSFPVGGTTILAARVLTSEQIPWTDIPAQTYSSKQVTPNIAALVQEVLGLPGWASGNAISVLLEPTTAATTQTDLRIFYGNGASETQKPTLNFTYYLPDETATITEIADEYTYESVNTADNTVTRHNINTEESIFYTDATSDPGSIAFRFDNIAIPENATIDEAFLKLTTSNGRGIFNANISAELSSTPALYASSEQRDRINTTAFEELAMGADPTTSPNLAAVLNEVVSLPTWISGDSFSIHMRFGTGYLHTGAFTQSIATSLAAVGLKPELVITYTENSSTTVASTNNKLKTGVRFPNLHVPPNAQIQSAVIEFHSNSATADAATFEIRGEAIGNAPEFNTTAANISSRTLTSAGVSWNVDPWDTVGNEFESIDVKNVIQEIVNRGDWCGGNAVAMIIAGITGQRDAISLDQSGSDAPSLNVTYAPDSVSGAAYCSNRSAVVPISLSTDDAVEFQSDSSIDLAATSLQLNTSSKGPADVALRFRALQLPQGATIVNAVVALAAANNIDGGLSMTLDVEDSDDSTPLDAGSGSISSRSWSTQSVNWGPLRETVSGSNLYTPDVTDLVSRIVSRPGWSQGNAMTFRLSAETGDIGQTTFHSFEGEEAFSPRLIVYYQDERSSPSALFKDNLKNQISELVAQDGTPIVDVLYEGALYMKGLPVDYGKQRGAQKFIDRNSRVSHPYSYTGGTVVRNRRCSDADLSSSPCKSEIITGSPVYTSPITNQCQQNHIVLLSDGEATSNTARDKVKSMIGQSNCTGSEPDETCGVELAGYLAGNDHAPLLSGQQNITTHTIGFNLDEPDFLKDIATAGEGKFYTANSSADLLNAFKNIFVNVSKTDTTFVAPTASINQFNRLKHREDIYFSLFKPDSTMRWSGNLKRYKIQGNEDDTADIVDANGANAVNPNTGQFEATAKSFWSGVTDGPDVSKGGAAAELESIGTRKILTYTGGSTALMAVENRVAVGNTNIDITDFDLPNNLATDLDYVDSLINWSAGFDAKDEDADGNTTENRVHMGDPLHSQPVIVNYGGTADAPDSVIYAATNEGYLHAFEQATGQEHFAFIPRQLFKNLRHYYENDVMSSRRYGLDGQITVWIKDNNNNGVVDAGAGDKAILYVGMRRGGRQIFALDVTDYDNPKYLWNINGAVNVTVSEPTTAQGDYTGMGQTWSRLNKTQLMGSSGPLDVIVFGGGFDPNNHDSVGGVVTGTDASGNATIDLLGRTIYIADAETGELLWKADNSGGDFSKMYYSVASDLRTIDINSDGLTDQIYFGDLGGQVWRIDINNDSGTGSLDSRISGGIIAEFGNTGDTNRRRFFYPPDLAVVSTGGQQFLSVSIGSGWRSHPLDNNVQDRFYTFRQTDVYNPPRDTGGSIRYTPITETTAGMVDVSTNTGSDATANIGWYFDMPSSGEKVLSSSVTLNGQIIFTSYIPSTTIDECAAAVGSGRVYVVDVLNGDPVVALGETSSAQSSSENLNISHRSKVLAHAGIPTSATVIFPETGDATILIGTEKLGSVEVGEPKHRTFWREHIDENS